MEALDVPRLPGSLRILAGLLALLLLTLVPVRGAGATITIGGITDQPVDTDHNGLFDWLVISIPLNVTATGYFLLFWSLRAGPIPPPFGSPPLLVTGQEIVNLSAGAHVYAARAYGPLISKADVNGTYDFSVSVAACPDASGYSCPVPVVANYVTQAYQAASFDLAPARLLTPITDFGRDMNGDGLFDQFVLTVPLEVVRPVTLSLQASMWLGGYDGFSMTTLSGGAARQLQPGTRHWELTIGGLYMRKAGMNGSHAISVEVGMEGVPAVLSILHTTRSYNYTDFTLPSATIRAGSTLTPVDLNADGLADRLVLSVPLHVLWTGVYGVDADLIVPGTLEPLVTHRALRLGPGDASVRMNFSGISVNRLPAGGPWTVELGVHRFDAAWYDADSASWTSPAYARSGFASAPPANLTGTLDTPDCVSQGICGWVIWAVDPIRDFVGTASSSPSYYGAPNTYSIALYPGTFDVFILPVNTAKAPTAFAVTLGGDTSRNVTFPDTPADTLDSTFRFAGANATEETLQLTYLRNAPFARLMADLWGNLDGQANASELEATAPYADYSQGVSFPGVRDLPYWVSYSTGPIAVDNQSLMAGPVEPVAATGAGDVLSPAQVGVTAVVNWTTGAPSLSLPSHRIKMALPYGSASFTGAYRIQLPAGSAANLMTDAGTARLLAPEDWEITTPHPIGFQGLIRVQIDGFLGTPPVGPAVLDATLVMALGAAGAAVAAVVAVLLVRRKRRRPPENEPQSP